jgi:hypothetical protein
MYRCFPSPADHSQPNHLLDFQLYLAVSSIQFLGQVFHLSNEYPRLIQFYDHVRTYTLPRGSFGADHHCDPFAGTHSECQRVNASTVQQLTTRKVKFRDVSVNERRNTNSLANFVPAILKRESVIEAIPDAAPAVEEKRNVEARQRNSPVGGFKEREIETRQRGQPGGGADKRGLGVNDGGSKKRK